MCRCSQRAQYARSGDVHIAYQVTGDGPFDLVFVPGFVTHLRARMDAAERSRRSCETLASVARLIRFDKRGMGLSDRTRADLPTLEERMDDVRAVMDAGKLRDSRRRWHLRGGAHGRCCSPRPIPSEPRALVLRSACPRALWAPGYPWGRTEQQYQPRHGAAN